MSELAAVPLVAATVQGSWWGIQKFRAGRPKVQVAKAEDLRLAALKEIKENKNEIRPGAMKAFLDQEKIAQARTNAYKEDLENGKYKKFGFWQARKDAKKVVKKSKGLKKLATTTSADAISENLRCENSHVIFRRPGTKCALCFPPDVVPFVVPGGSPLPRSVARPESVDITTSPISGESEATVPGSSTPPV